MSAAATAAGYLYASGRLRGRRDNEHHDNEHHRDDDHHRDNDRHYGRGERAPAAKAVTVAVYQPREMPAPQTAAPPAPVAKKTPKIAYRTRRWRPE
jgi:hypothetical protein